MSTYRRTARVVGVLYIIGTVAGVLSMVLIRPVSMPPITSPRHRYTRTGWPPERCVCSSWPSPWWGSRSPSTRC
jgi:hypothetical protein